MRASAPGKIVVSGAYAVLEGAPAIVAAVDRRVVADSSRASERLTDEVAAAIAMGALASPPWFDASALRTEDGARKLGLGSSAAILVASLAAVDRGDDAGLAARVFPIALEAHRRAQHGGSGVDVASSAFGGLVVCRLRASLEVAQLTPPHGLVIEIFASALESSTPGMLARVRALASRDPATHRACLDRAAHGAAAAANATEVRAFLEALGEQHAALQTLGRAAGCDIVPEDHAALRALALKEHARFGPSGAGGGDVSIFVGGAPSSEAFRCAAEAHGLVRLDAVVGAPGVRREPLVG